MNNQHLTCCSSLNNCSLEKYTFVLISMYKHTRISMYSQTETDTKNKKIIIKIHFNLHTDYSLEPYPVVFITHTSCSTMLVNCCSDLHSRRFINLVMTELTGLLSAQILMTLLHTKEHCVHEYNLIAYTLWDYKIPHFSMTRTQPEIRVLK